MRFLATFPGQYIILCDPVKNVPAMFYCICLGPFILRFHFFFQNFEVKHLALFLLSRSVYKLTHSTKISEIHTFHDNFLQQENLLLVLISVQEINFYIFLLVIYIYK